MDPRVIFKHSDLLNNAHYQVRPDSWDAIVATALVLAYLYAIKQALAILGSIQATNLLPKWTRVSLAISLSVGLSVPVFQSVLFRLFN